MVVVDGAFDCITYSISEKIYCFGFGDDRDTWALILCCHRLQYICDKRLYLSLSDFNLRSPRYFVFFPFSRLSLALRYWARYLLIRGNVICVGVVWPSLPLSVVLLFSFVAYLSRPCARPFGSNQKAPGYVLSLHLPLFFCHLCLSFTKLAALRSGSQSLFGNNGVFLHCSEASTKGRPTYYKNMCAEDAKQFKTSVFIFIWLLQRFPKMIPVVWLPINLGRRWISCLIVARFTDPASGMIFAIVQYKFLYARLKNGRIMPGQLRSNSPKMFVCPSVRPSVRVLRTFLQRALRYQFETWYIHSVGGTTCRVWVASQLGHFDLVYSQK